MLSSIRRIIPVLLLIAAPLFAAQAPDPLVMVPLLPNDDGNSVKFTKASFQQLLAAQKTSTKNKTAALANGGLGLFPLGFVNDQAIAMTSTALVDYLTLTSYSNYIEGAPPAGHQIYTGWPWIYGQSEISRSTYGLIGLSLMKSLEHAPELFPFSGTNPYARVYGMAQELVADYNGNGPLAATKAPFMADVIFLAEWEDNNLKPPFDFTNYKTIATNWFNRIKDLSAPGDGLRDAGAEVTRIYAARQAQGVPELTGYDVGLLIKAAKAVGENTYATTAEMYLSTIGWEVQPPVLATAYQDSLIRSSTGNMLSRAMLMAADPGLYDYSTFFAGAQQTGGSLPSGLDPTGSFLPSGGIQSNSWIITALAMSGDVTGANWNVAKNGCGYLLKAQNFSGYWGSYPLFNINDVYPIETAAALLALSSTAFPLEIENIYDREANYRLSDVSVKISNGTDSVMVESDNGRVHIGGLMDDSPLTATPFVDENLDYQLRGIVIGSFDASIVLEESIKSPPFGDDPGALYGWPAGAVMACDLELQSFIGPFSNTDVNVLIASQILAYAVGNPPIPPDTPVFDFFYPGMLGSLASSKNLGSYDYSGKMLAVSGGLVLTGDVSNNYGLNYGFFEPIITLLAGAASPKPTRTPMQLSLESYTRQDGKLLLPVVLSRVADASSGAQAFQFEVTYDASALTYLGLRSGEIAKGFMYADNGRQPGVVVVAMANGQALTKDGTIAWLEFRSNSGAAVLPESFGLQKMFINELAVVSESGGSVLETTATNSIASGVGLPKAFSLGQNNPNPFNPSTTINYSIPEASEPVEVRLSVFNLRGQVVRTLVEGRRPAGSYSVHWDGLDRQGQRVPSGVYFYRLEAGSYSKTRKMVILK